MVVAGLRIRLLWLDPDAVLENGLTRIRISQIGHVRSECPDSKSHWNHAIFFFVTDPVFSMVDPGFFFSPGQLQPDEQCW